MSFIIFLSPSYLPSTYKLPLLSQLSFLYYSLFTHSFLHSPVSTLLSPLSSLDFSLFLYQSPKSYSHGYMPFKKVRKTCLIIENRSLDAHSKQCLFILLLRHRLYFEDILTKHTVQIKICQKILSDVVGMTCTATNLSFLAT